MSAAHELAERGYDVTVYEKKDMFGGKARSHFAAEVQKLHGAVTRRRRQRHRRQQAAQRDRRAGRADARRAGERQHRRAGDRVVGNQRERCPGDLGHGPADRQQAGIVLQREAARGHAQAAAESDGNAAAGNVVGDIDRRRVR